MQPSLKKNYLYRIFYEVLILITPFITTPYVSRVLGADGIGDYSFSHSIITYFMLFGALGTAGYGAREIARARNDSKLSSKLFWEIELMTVFTTGICLLIWIGVIIFSEKYRYCYIALSPFLISTMFDISWYFTGLEKVKNIVIRNSIVRILGIILLFFLVREKNDLILYCVINSVTSLIGTLSMWLYLPKMLERVSFKELRFKHHFHETLIYFIPTIATSVYTVLDKTLIGIITGDSYQNGYYEQATKVINIVKSFVFVAVNSVMGARISYLFSENKISEIKSRILKSMDFIYFLAYGTVFGIVGIASRFVPLFFGAGYDEVVEILYCMVPLIVIIGTSNCLGSQYYTPSGQRKKSAKIIVMGAIINLILNIIMIPSCGVYGATIASVIAELFITICYVGFSNGYMSWNSLVHFSYKRILSGGIMYFLIVALGRCLNFDQYFIVGIQILSGGLVYFSILYLLNDSIVKYLVRLLKDRIYK